MNVTLENIGNNTAKIVVNVEAADYTDKVKNELKKFANTHTIPGFRKGHVPTDQVRKRYGKAIKSDVINDLVYREVVNYIKENHINILGEPLPVDVQQIDLDDKDYTFEYEVGLTPVIDIPLNKDLTLPYYTITVSDEMRDEQDTAFRQRFGSQVPGEEVEDRALVKGSIMELNADGSVKETEDAIQVINGIVCPSFFKSKEEGAKFDGKRINDKVVFNPYNSCEGNVAELSSMLNIDKEQAPTVTGDFVMSIAEIIVLRPAEHDQEFFDNVFGADKVHNDEEYNEALTQMIANQLRGNSDKLFSRDVYNYFIEHCQDLELPEAFLKKWLVARNEELTTENIDAEYTQMKNSLIWELVKNYIVSTLEVVVTEEDLLNYAKSIAYQQFAQYGITNLDDDTILPHAKQILANGEYRRNIADQVENAKMFAALEQAINLDVKELTIDEFRELASKE